MFRTFAISLILFLALALSAAAQEGESFSLTILHTNDEHAYHEPNGNGDGGVARLASVVKQVRAEQENVLLLDAGDRFTGTLFHTVHVGEDQITLMNALGYDAMTLGNHEFDGHKNDPNILENFVNGLVFPVVSANVDLSAYPNTAEKVLPYVILDVNGAEIGIIGLTTATTVTSSTPAADVVFDGDYAAVTQAVVDELTAAGINKIILITHLGVTDDFAFITQVSGVDVVVGGHSHTLLANAYTAAEGEYPIEFSGADGNPIVYVQAGQYGQYVGLLEVTFNAEGVLEDWGGDAIFLSKYITPDPEIEGIVNELKAPVDELRNTSIGATTDVFLTGDRSVCRIEECNLGNLIADAMRAESGAQISIMNGGGIRADIEPGEITLGEVLTVHPFGNTISTFQASGADIIAALENGVSGIRLGDDGKVTRQGGAGRFPQVSGLRYSFDPNLEPGSRIVSVEVLGADGEYSPIDPEAIYSVVTNNFIRTGGDGYSMFAENAINPYDFGRPDYEVTRDYMVANSPITIGVEGRITILNAEVAPR